MRWTPQDEQILTNLAKENKTLQEIASTIHRSPEAITMKLKRMGLQTTENHFVKNGDNKVTTTTTTKKLESLKFEEIPSANEAMGLLWAAVKRLQEPGISMNEIKQLRLIMQGVKNYIHLESGVVLRLRRTESSMLSQWIHFVELWKFQKNQAKTAEEKDRLEKLILEAQQSIKEYRESGVKELPDFTERYECGGR